MAFLIIAIQFAHAAGADDQLWLYYPTNLLVDKNVDKAAEIWKRAANSGYTHVLLTDSKFAKLGDMDDRYFKNISRIQKVGKDLKLEIVPALFDVGYSNNLLWHDPNLAEGFPVKDQPFVVRTGTASPSEKVEFPGKFGFKDDSVKIVDRTATINNNTGNARFTYNMKLPMYRSYHITVKIKTDNYTGTPEIKVHGQTAKRDLQWRNLKVKKTQDWTEHHIVFNTLDSDSQIIYFGIWGDATGTMQWKDWSISESNLVNLLRRDGTPFIIKTEGGIVLKEGTDYEPVVDKQMGNNPWKGEFDVWHEGPTIKLKNQPDGTKLLVSWYHPMVVYDEQVAACIGDPKMNILLADQAQRMKKAWNTAGYMMSHDEFRTLGWDETCTHKHETPGKMLADNVKFCTSLLQGSQIYTWSDMFDPHHNAVKGPYYLVNGPWTDSWLGLEKSVTIMNWNFGKRDESLKFFAERGHHQIIAAYYDGPMSNTRKWVESAAKVGKIDGFMYTTWKNDYKQIEEFAKVVRK